MFGWVTAFETFDLWNLLHSPKKGAIGGDILGLALGISFLCMTVLSWPVTVEISGERLTWHHMLFRHHAAWRDVEDVNTITRGGLVIYLSGNRRINVGEYTEGRPELKSLILRRIGHPDQENPFGVGADGDRPSDMTC
jgi:hypothetical protein